jgi:hypothetical protein
MSSNILYKYRSWNNDYHKLSLLKNQIYFAPPLEFNDPFDCRIIENYGLLTDAEKLDYVNWQIQERFPSKVLAPKERLELQNRLVKRISNVDEYHKNADKLMFDSQNRHYGIFCLSKEWDNILLWSHYAYNHRGFCIGYSFKHLKDFLLSQSLNVKADFVKYQEDFPALKPKPRFTSEDAFNRAFIQTYTKAEKWIYEKEFRILRSKFPEEMNIHDRVINLPDNCIQEIILGISIPANDKLEIIKTCKIRSLPVYQAQRIPFKFLIKRDPIYNL